MKHSYLKQKSLFRLFLVLIIALISIGYGCRKDLLKMGQSNTASVLAEHHIDLARIQTTYNTGINSKFKVAAVSQQTLATIIGSLNVDWTTYVVYTNPDSSQVVEFAMPDDKNFILPAGTTGTDSAKYHSKTAAVFIVRKDTVSMSFFMKTVEDGTAPGYQPALSQVHYKHIPATFSGSVYYFTLGRQFLNGYVWDKGTISKTLSINAAPAQHQTQSVSPALKTNTADPNGCLSFTVEVWYTRILMDGTVVWDEIRSTFSVTVCGFTGSGGGGGSPGSGGGGGGGGAAGDGTPLGIPCIPQTPPPTVVESVKGKIIINQLEGGGGGGPAPVPCPTTAVPKIIVDSLSKKLPCATQLILNKLLSIPGYNNFVHQFTTILKPDLTWKTDNLPWNTPIANSTATTYVLGYTGYEGRSATITLNNNMLNNSSQLLIAAAAIHETLHAYINYNIENSIGGFNLTPSNYNNNSSWIYAIDTWATINGLPGNYSDHYQMLNDYFNQSINILASWDNNAHSQQDYAKAMLYGLDNAAGSTPAQQSLLQTEFNLLLNQYGLTLSDLSTFNINNLNSTSNKLPKSGCN